MYRLLFLCLSCQMEWIGQDFDQLPATINMSTLFDKEVADDARQPCPCIDPEGGFRITARPASTDPAVELQATLDSIERREHP